MSYYNPVRVPHIDKREVLMAQQYELPVEIVSYKQALEWWKKRDGLWRSSDRPAGKTDHYTRRMRQRSDGTIVFDYSNNELAAWHPDNTLTVSPHGGYVNGAFDRFVMPRTIEASSGPRTGKVVLLKLQDEMMTSYRGRYNQVQLETDSGTKWVTNPDILVVRAETPVTLHRGDGGRWEPVSEFKLKPFYWYELDKGQLREASKKYNIPEFITAIETAIKLGADIETSKSWTDVNERKTESGEDVLTLLEQSRFVEAAALVRPAETSTYDSATGKWVTEKHGFNSTDIKRVRQMAYVEMGLIYLETERIVSLPQWRNIERKLLDFGTPAQ